MPAVGGAGRHLDVKSKMGYGTCIKKRSLSMGTWDCTGTFFAYTAFVGRFPVIPASGFTGISHLPAILAGTNEVEVTGNECIIKHLPVQLISSTFGCNH